MSYRLFIFALLMGTWMIFSGLFDAFHLALGVISAGLVTCLYRARPGNSFASLLDALWISAEFQGQVLLARALQGVRFALGATMVLRRADLESIGGFAALRPYLADDYQLGQRVAALGRKVVVSPHPVETVLAGGSWRGVWRRHLRWSRTIRASRPAGHAGLVATHGTLWSLGANVAVFVTVSLATVPGLLERRQAEDFAVPAREKKTQPEQDEHVSDTSIDKFCDDLRIHTAQD